MATASTAAPIRMSGDGVSAGKIALLALQILAGCVLALNAGAMTWIVSRQDAQAVVMQKHGESIAEITASQFTAADGLAVYQRMADLANLISAMPTESPPKWFLENVQGLERKVDDLSDEVVELRIELTARDDRRATP
jgi:hypothetical protein